MTELSTLGRFFTERWRRDRLDRWAEVGIMIVALGWCAMRFIGLEKVPYGLSTDETLAGLHVICLAQTGASADGHPWPLFATGIAGGMYTPAYLYTLLAWTRLFGTSIGAVVGLALLARRVGNGRAARLAVAAAALSPWSFQWSRLAVDDPMAPALL